MDPAYTQKMRMIISAKDITKSYSGLQVLKGVDFSAEKGEIVAIVGASGAGKTTLLQVLGTLLTPDSGTLEIDSERVTGLSADRLAAFRSRKVGFVFQSHHLMAEFTALENVMIPALIAGKSKSEAKSKAVHLLREVALEERLNHKPSELSGGEQQRVAIARAMVNSPSVLFADEPTGNLDSRTKEEIHKVFFSLRESTGQTIVIVTHDEHLASLCDRCLVMKDGRFV